LNVTADTIRGLLAQKHATDVFVPECKNGPTTAYGADLLILDAWAMKKSWSQPAIYGYEIKVDRSDFLRDEKWDRYLPFCNYFSFVCPRNLIDQAELPMGVGLLYVASTGTRLVTKRKAARREIEPPVDVFQYILQSRALIDREREEGRGAAYWREWLAQKKEKRHLAHEVSKAIREHVEAVEQENEKLKKRIEAYDKVEAWFEREGLRFDTWHPTMDLRRQREEAQRLFPKQLVWTIERTIRELADLRKLVGKYEQKAEEKAA
jgi:hypothetical protein